MLGTSDVLDRLRVEGFDVSAGYLQYLIRERIFEPPAQRIGGAYAWEDADVRRLRSLLVRRGRGPTATADPSKGPGQGEP